MPLFGSESDVMRSGAPGVMNGMPVSGGPQGAPQGQQMPMPPQGQPPGQPVQPSASEQALANQVYQLQHMVMQLQQQQSDMMKRRVAMQFDFLRDRDGRLVGMTATEGVR